MNFNFFEKKTKSVDNYSKQKKHSKTALKKQISTFNWLESLYDINNIKKNSKLSIEKEVSRLSISKMMKKLNLQRNSSFLRNSSFKAKKPKKNTIESTFLLGPNKKIELLINHHLLCQDQLKYLKIQAKIYLKLLKIIIEKCLILIILILLMLLK